MGNRRLVESSWNKRLRERNRRARYTACTICDGEVVLDAIDMAGRCPTCVQEARVVKHKVTIVGAGTKDDVAQQLINLGNQLIKNEIGGKAEELICLNEDWGKLNTHTHKGGSYYCY